MSESKYVQVNAIGMSFGRPKAHGSYYEYGTIVPISELKQWGYANESLLEHLKSGVVVERTQAEYERFIGGEKFHQEATVKRSDGGTVTVRRPLPPSKELDVVEELPLEEEDEEEEDKEKEFDTVDEFELTRDGLTIEEYWNKYKNGCPACKKKHRSKIGLWECHG